jgi:predicted transcriptional regulator
MSDHLQLTARIVSSYLAKARVDSTLVPSIIRSVHEALANAARGGSVPAAPREPAVPIRKSVFPNYIVCLEDGRKLKTLKRHLQASFRLTPEAYRAKWGLPPDYPMVAPSYAATRSSLAKKSGLGRKRPPEPAVSKPPARRAKGAKR